MTEYNIGVFISHSWAYSEHYKCLAEWIFNGSWSANGIPVRFLDASIPKDNPIHNAPNEQVLTGAILQRMAYAAVVVIPTGMYASHSKWIGKEIGCAKQLGKPILAVNPWGQERKSSVVGSNADLNVGWNKAPVAKGIWKLSPYG